jgi:alpha-ketoglutarate-dependent taurine dioxygenase
MTKITVTRLTDAFAAEVGGADIAQPLDDATWAEIRPAFEEHSVLVFRGTALDDARQIAVGDLIVWDNRWVLHRATPYDATRYTRLMQRTTIGGGRDLDG